MKISQNKSVSLSYELYVGEGDDHELMEKATVETPLQFIYGTNMMLPSFEKNLEDLQKGDSFDFVIPSADAYGDYVEENVIDLPKNIFEVEGKFDENVVFEGATLPMMDTNGNRMNGSVVSVGESTVTMDFNHPLAGEDLHFIGSVLEVKEATPEEIAALFSGGCGCGEDCNCNSEEGGSDCGCGGNCK